MLKSMWTLWRKRRPPRRTVLSSSLHAPSAVSRCAASRTSTSSSTSFASRQVVSLAMAGVWESMLRWSLKTTRLIRRQ
ncbi:hypothetical protein FR483_n829R [Paramecium bursaria Chlorella virus FR483]|uniref:Uncharacterized protein n829R n=1 Tax=Paramecium bursaria Chlorella virus FR483 TaxID=399781 RepID=A7J8I3_PBCVF|nr:hypothetical protein FR483_n829R [Paramecium bursaria Chlorella virus FR483]ABT16114.1 hypothetical protein FR483_n829R [Paramecium bursaria Chlorella virus FR483]